MLIRRPLLFQEQDESGGTATAADDRTAEFIAAIDASNEAAGDAVEDDSTSTTETDESTTVTTDETEDTGEVETTSTETPSRQRDSKGRFVKAEDSTEETEATDSTAEEFQESLTSTEGNFLTDELRELGSSYGFTDEVMLSQGSEESLRNAMQLIDQYEARRAGINRQHPPEEPPTQETPPAPPQQEQAPPAETPTEETQENFLSYIQTLKDNGYDEEVTKPLEALYQQNQQLMQQMQGFQQHAERVQQGAVQNYQNQVLGMIDGLGRNDLFGTDREYTPQQQQNAVAMDQTIQWLTQTQGLPLDKTTVKRAFNMNFGDQLMHENRVKKSEAVQQQSQKRMGTGAPTTPRDDIPWDGELADDPVIKAFYNNAMQENGYR